jgi:hypothetical protein
MITTSKSTPIHWLLAAMMTTALTTLGGCGGEDRASYSRDIEPILHVKCQQCHTRKAGGRAAGGFAVDSYFSVMQGGKDGLVLDIHNPEASKLPKIMLGKLRYYEGDSSHYAPMNQKQRDKLAEWVRAGVLDN